MVLEELGLVIEFPPGVTILIPSASITHSNAAIAKDETHYSFTQFTAGSIFRWVDHRFMNDADFWQLLSNEEYEIEVEKQNNRLEDGLKLFRQWK